MTPLTRLRLRWLAIHPLRRDIWRRELKRALTSDCPTILLLWALFVVLGYLVMHNDTLRAIGAALR